MWGGLTTPGRTARHRRSVAEKFNIPTVKVTGGQRIDLLGVQKGRFARRLGRSQQGGPGLGPCLRQGAAHGENLRRLANGAGSARRIPPASASSWRRCAGARGRRTRSSSRCPAVRAIAPKRRSRISASSASRPATTSLVGGNGGIEVRVTDPLVRVATEDEVLEYAGAFLQLYREEAHYLERTAPWIARVGLAYVKKRLVEDAAGRRRASRPLSAFPKHSCRTIPGPSAPRAPMPTSSPASGAGGGVTMDSLESGRISGRSTTFRGRARAGSASATADGRSRFSARARTTASSR